jgi:hypothetical protein
MLRDSMLLRYGSSEGRTSRAPRRIGRHAVEACGKVEKWRCSKELALLHQPTVTGWKVSNLKNLAPPENRTLSRLRDHWLSWLFSNATVLPLDVLVNAHVGSKARVPVNP